MRCVSCHASTPDGNAVVFTDDFPWSKVTANVTEEERGLPPSYVTEGASTAIQMPWLGTQTMSAGHWTSGDRVLVASYGERQQPFSSSSSGRNPAVYVWNQNDVIVDQAVQDAGIQQSHPRLGRVRHPQGPPANDHPLVALKNSAPAGAS